MTPASPPVDKEDKKSKFCPSPEELELDIAYGFNLNIDPTCLKKLSFPQQYEFYVSQLEKLRHSDIELVTYPELSHKGKLHLHGYIKFKSYLAIAEFYFQLCFFPHHIYIHTIEDYDKREIYMTKSQHIMKPLCDKYQKAYKIHTKVPEEIAEIVQALKPKTYNKNKKYRKNFSLDNI